jgi:hypothetical protein
MPSLIHTFADDDDDDLSDSKDAKSEVVLETRADCHFVMLTPGMVWYDNRQRAHARTIQQCQHCLIKPNLISNKVVNHCGISPKIVIQ